MSKHKVAIVGINKSKTGIGPFVGRAFMYCAEDRGDVELVAGTSTSELGAQEFKEKAKKYGIEFPATMKGYSVRTPEDLGYTIEESGSDIVAICSPHHTHYGLAQKALDAGAHVLLEKPLVDPNDPQAAEHAFELMHKAKDSGLTLTTNTTRRNVMAHILRDNFEGQVPFNDDIYLGIHTKGSSSVEDLITDLGPHLASMIAYTSKGVGQVANLSRRGSKVNTASRGFSYFQNPGQQKGARFIMQKQPDRKNPATQIVEIGKRQFRITGEQDETPEKRFHTVVRPIVPQPHESREVWYDDITDTQVDVFMDGINIRKTNKYQILPQTPAKTFEAFVMTLFLAGKLTESRANKWLDQAQADFT